MLIWVERSSNPGEVATASDRIGWSITAGLKEHGVASIVDPSPVMQLRSRHPEEYRSMPLTELGRISGAKQVLSVDLTNYAFEGAMAANILKGKIKARVRVIDVETGRTRWPQDTTQGYPIVAATPYSETDDRNLTESGIRENLGKELADQIAHLFYKYTTDDVDSGSKAFKE